MQLFEKWQSVTDAYKSFYEEAEHLGLEVVTFLKHFSQANDTVKNAILKMFDSESNSKTHLLGKQIERAEQCLSLIRSELVNFDAYLIIQYLIVELLKNGGFDD